jgi:2-isopropylmalate synthase
MEVFGRFKDLADKKKEIYDEDLIALVGDQILKLNEHIKFVSLSVNAGSLEKHIAVMTLEIDGIKKIAKASGNGPVDATFNAIKEITNIKSNLKLYQVHAITAGTDAQGEVTVRLADNDISSQSKGSDPDIIVASAKAYINALNKLIFKKSKSAPDKISEVQAKGV